MNIRLIHAADLHMDSPFEGLSREKAAIRRSEQRELLYALMEECDRREADMLLLSGDLLDSAAASTETGEALVAALGSLSIPAFIAPGNHDWYSRRSPYARLPFPENVHIFKTPSLESRWLPELGIRVWGAGYTSPSCPPLLRGFSPRKQQGVLDILVLHAELGRPESGYCPITEDELSRSGMDYAALGHIHTGSGLRKAGKTFYAWPGCPEGRGFDECGEKGVLQIDFQDNDCAAEFITLGRRRYEKLSVEAGADPLKSVRARLPNDTQGDIYKIMLTGERDAAPDMLLLQKALEDRFFALTLEDHTVPRRELWDRAGENTLCGRFLRRMRSKLAEAGTEDERELIMQAVRLGMAALEEREVQL